MTRKTIMCMTFKTPDNGLRLCVNIRKGTLCDWIQSKIMVEALHEHEHKTENKSQ